MTDKLNELSKTLKVKRAMKGFTQKELAEKSGVSSWIIYSIENCVKKPRATTLVKISKALDVDENELLKFII